VVFISNACSKFWKLSIHWYTSLHIIQLSPH
jgi:hypothetical protein